MSANPEIVRVLKSAALFKSFTDTGLQIIASIAHEKSVPAGAPLFVEQMIGDGLYIVADGMVRLASRDPNGREITLALLGPGESLGEAAVLRTGPRLCSAFAEVPTRVVEITRRDVAMLQRSKPQAVVKLMMSVTGVIGNRLGAAQDDMRRFLAWKLGM